MTFKNKLLTALLASLSISAYADIVHNDDVIVVGSHCAGLDCVNGESFGFDTIRLKENNLRIRFFDTSNSASFPTRDWQLTANETSNGGLEKFSIDDIDGGRTPFTIEANAPSHSLYVDDGGRLGLGTATPVVDAHIVSGNTPTLRLEQNGSSGFSAQTWDLAGNEANFFIRDVNNGSQLPLQIKPGADTASLFIDADNDIGLGTASPGAALHLRRTNGTAGALIEDTTATQAARNMMILRNVGNPQIVLDNTGSVDKAWTMSGGFNYVIKNDADTTVFTLADNGDVIITGDITTTGGTCGSGCDLVFSTEIESIAEHAAAMWANKHLPSVGPTMENQPINLSQKTGGMLNELEKAHIYIEQLHNRLSALESRLEGLSAGE